LEKRDLQAGIFHRREGNGSILSLVNGYLINDYDAFFTLLSFKHSITHSHTEMFTHAQNYLLFYLIYIALVLCSVLLTLHLSFYLYLNYQLVTLVSYPDRRLVSFQCQLVAVVVAVTVDAVVAAVFVVVVDVNVVVSFAAAVSALDCCYCSPERRHLWRQHSFDCCCYWLWPV